MGIPHLITSLEPYAELEALAGQEVVVDGPAFAYHVYYLCLRTKRDARGPFEAAPSYAQISKTAIEWLDALQEHGVKIQKIYFDGFLPPSKFDVRLSRLVGLTRRMSDYYYANQRVSLHSTEPDSETTILFGASSIPSRLTALPPPPFLVPSVLEGLSDSGQYKRLTHVVPGEADLYCSQYLSQHGGIVLTGDSDLLVHDLGSSGKVGFLRDLRVVGSGVLKCQTYWPSAIVQRLALPLSHGLTSLAFEMKMDPYGSFAQFLIRAKALKAIESHSVLYKDFQSDYQTLLSEPPENAGTDNAPSLLQRLDPRISEYILQFPCIAELAGQKTGIILLPDVHVFLPFIIDCPTKTSAWEMSTSIRQVAYALINLVVPDIQQRNSVFEHKKQTDKSNGRELTLPSIDDLEDVCENATQQIIELRDRLAGNFNRDYWLAFAVYQDIDFANLHSKLCTTTPARRQAPDGKVGKTVSWDIIQLFAQVQASYYSFRILKQISSFIVALKSRSCLPEYVLRLHDQMSTIPNLTELHDLSEISSIMRLIETSKIFDIVCGILGIEIQNANAPVDSVKASKKKRKREHAAALQRYTKSTNSFALLEAE